MKSYTYKIYKRFSNYIYKSFSLYKQFYVENSYAKNSVLTSKQYMNVILLEVVF